MKKLVRDKIPDLFPGKDTHIADDNEYGSALLEKLQEEVDEFKESGRVEELADIIEVIDAISENKGSSLGEIESFRKKKAEKRGKFEKRIIREI